MSELIPLPNSVLINTLMSVYTTEVISTDLLNPEWTFELIPLDNAPSNVLGVNFNIEASNVIVFDYFNSSRLFPVKELSYVDNTNKAHTVNSLGDLPVDHTKSPYITRFISSDKNYFEWRLNVSVTGLEESDPDDGLSPTITLPVTLTGSYTIRIEADYNENRQILRGLLDERSNI